MRDLTASIPHQITRSEAKLRLQDHVRLLREKHGVVVTNLTDSWADDTMTFTLTAMGQPFSGRIVVDDHAVNLTVALPWLLRMLAGTIKPRIEQEGRLILGPKQKTTIS